MHKKWVHKIEQNFRSTTISNNYCNTHKIKLTDIDMAKTQKKTKFNCYAPQFNSTHFVLILSSPNG